MMPILCANIHTQTTRNAILKLLLNFQVMLVFAAHKFPWHIESFAVFRALANAETYLRSNNKKALHASSFASKAEICKQRYLDIVKGALIGI